MATLFGTEAEIPGARLVLRLSCTRILGAYKLSHICWWGSSTGKVHQRVPHTQQQRNSLLPCPVPYPINLELSAHSLYSLILRPIWASKSEDAIDGNESMQQWQKTKK